MYEAVLEVSSNKYAPIQRPIPCISDQEYQLREKKKSYKLENCPIPHGNPTAPHYAMKTLVGVL